MRLLIAVLIALVLQSPASGSTDLIVGTTPKSTQVFVVKRHPLLRKFWRGTTWPVRKTALGCKWLGDKSAPYHNFFALCGYTGSAVNPVATWMRH